MNNRIKYGLLGHPLGHSFSRGFHNQRFKDLGINAVYENFDLDEITVLPQVLADNPDLRGLNVTIPYKQAVMPFLDQLDPVAERIGAVNTVRIERVSESETTRIPGVRLIGYNTDIIGFRNSIAPMLDESHRHALILGTGGASKAIRVALDDMGLTTMYVSRTAAEDRLTYEQLTPEVMARYTVIVNCTPLGMFPKVDACPDIPYHLLTPFHVCFDAIYNPAVTLFMAKAAEQGAKTRCGQEMLEGQAIASYEIWTR